MKYKWLVLLLIIFISCNRDIQKSTISNVNRNDTKEGSGLISSTEIGNTHEAALSEGDAEVSLIQKPHLQLTKNIAQPILSNEHVNTNHKAKKSFVKNKYEIKAVKKEMDPRLSTALIMTIFGGVAVTLGLVFSKYIPAGLFVFAFGIVFLVGLITLFMYLANPKPKL